MGAWGEGLQANDTALDAIGGYEDQLAEIVHDKDPARTAIVLEQISHGLDGDYSAWGLLGAAEHLLDACGPEEGVRILAQARPILDQALDTELAQAQLDCWQDPAARRQALELFRQRLGGERVDPRAVERTNEGLLSRITREMSGMSYEEAYEEDPPSSPHL